MGSCFGCLLVDAGNLQKWGSNHLALACELAFLSGILNFNTNNPGRESNTSMLLFLVLYF